MTVSWAPPRGQIVVRGYKIGYGVGSPDQNEIETDKNTNSLTIGNLEPETQYVMRLQAFNNFGDGLPEYFYGTTQKDGGMYSEHCHVHDA